MRKINCFQVIFILITIAIFSTVTFNKSYAEEALREMIRNDIEQIIQWKKASYSISDEHPLLSSQFLNHAGDASGDWYPFAIGRIGYPDDYQAYLAVLAEKVSKRYLKGHKLDESKATEWHRISLATLAVGGDPTQLGVDKNGTPINLIADGTYYRNKDKPLGFQGINGLTWGLITIDSLGYKIPADATITRNDIIREILEQQLPDGGFTLNGNSADPDITGMVIQALAPYYNSEQVYKYTMDSTNENVTKTVREVVDEALQALSNIQLDNGAFRSFDIENTESIVQVIVALTTLEMNPTKDERFIKNGNTLIDALKSFQMDDGGFIHSKEVDPDNPNANPNKSNSMASEQALYALVALYRFYENARLLYDFREELDVSLKEKIDSLRKEIDKLPNQINESDKETVEQLFKQYKEIQVPERRYVFNYYKLADAMKKLNIENDSEFIADYMGLVESGNGTVTPLFHNELFSGPIIFTAEDVKNIEQLLKNLTTEQYVEVVKLIDKLENAENRVEYEYLLGSLIEKKESIELIQAEIDALNKEIMDQLFPFDQLSFKDREKINEIIDRYETLSDYDKQKIVNYEDVERAKAEVDSKVRMQSISTFLGITLMILAVWFVVRRRKKKREKQIEFIDSVD